jgi:Cys-tRNA(Pro) deacylase
MDAASTTPTSMTLADQIASGAIRARIILPGVPTPTVPDAAEALGVSAEQIIKSLLFTTRSGELVLAVATGDSRIDRKRLAAEIGARDVKLAAPDTVLGATGYAAGGTPPVGHRTPVQVLIDQRVMRLDVAYGGGGRVDALLEIAPTEICRVTGARVVDIAS